MAKKNSHNERSDADRRIRQSERLARLMQVLYLISGRGRWDAAALAEELECSTRTIHRLLQTLSMAGVPYYYCDRTKAYRVRPGYKFPLLDVDHRTVKEIPDSVELDEAMEKLLRHGEEFASSLNSFLNTLRHLKDE